VDDREAEMGQQCRGELFDGTPCNSYLYVCRSCDVRGCQGDGCEWQAFLGPECDGCSTQVERLSAAAA
jgi:hypothetical protein